MKELCCWPDPPQELAQLVRGDTAGLGVIHNGRHDGMPRRRYTVGEIMGKLRGAEALL